MKPILFNTEMVRAILSDRKTVTRRIIKPQPPDTVHVQCCDGKYVWAFWENGENHLIKCTYDVDDILYVRETWSTHYTADSDGRPVYCYKADGTDLKAECLPGENNRWYPSIHMPKVAARLFLQVTDVRAERLQDITPVGLRMEGIQVSPIFDPWDCEMSPEVMRCFEFERIWDSTIKKKDLDRFGWNANPWVWVITFERVEKPL